MVTALDVANYIFQKQGWVEHKKLQKLIYFSQAWHLTWDGRALFDGKFEAWVDGPVERQAYIAKRWNTSYGGAELPGGDPERLDSSAKAVVDAVLAHYGEMTTSTLIELSHEQPWEKARGDLAPTASCQNQIADTDIKRWYTAKVIKGEQNIPKRPPVQAWVSAEGYSEAVDYEIERWADGLKLLAER